MSHAAAPVEPQKDAAKASSFEADPTKIIAFKTPKVTLLYLIKVGVAKSLMPAWHTAWLGFFAGCYVGLGALLALTLAGGLTGPEDICGPDSHGKYKNPAILKIVMGATFPVALMLIVIAGSDLFTGNVMYMLLAVLEKKCKIKDLVRVWCVSWSFNFLGCVFIAYFLSYLTGQFDKEPLHSFVKYISDSKMNQKWGVIFLKAIGANWLVCASIYFGIASESMEGKVMAFWWPIFAFVGIGFEHCIANMFFIPMGLMIGAEYGNFGVFIGEQLIPATLGNIVGGGFFIGIAQWAVFRDHFHGAVERMKVVPGAFRSPAPAPINAYSGLIADPGAYDSVGMNARDSQVISGSGASTLEKSNARKNSRIYIAVQQHVDHHDDDHHHDDQNDDGSRKSNSSSSSQKDSRDVIMCPESHVSESPAVSSLADDSSPPPRNQSDIQLLPFRQSHHV